MAGGARQLLAGDDAEVTKLLERELARLRTSQPLDSLSLDGAADPAAIRARFLELTHAYHPNRFARRPPALRKLANEVFPLIRRAHERAMEQSGVPTRKMPALKSEPARPASIVPGSATAGQARADVDAALQRVRRAMNPRLKTNPGVPAPQPAAAAPVAPAAATPAAPAPPASARDVVERARQREEEQKERFRAAVMDLRSGKLARARDTLRALTAENGGEKRYRAYFYYALGREHHAAGKNSEARAEYERALSLDASLDAARQSLDLLDESEPPKPTSGGKIARWFRR